MVNHYTFQLLAVLSNCFPKSSIPRRGRRITSQYANQVCTTPVQWPRPGVTTIYNQGDSKFPYCDENVTKPLWSSMPAHGTSLFMSWTQSPSTTEHLMVSHNCQVHWKQGKSGKWSHLRWAWDKVTGYDVISWMEHNYSRIVFKNQGCICELWISVGSSVIRTALSIETHSGVAIHGNYQNHLWSMLPLPFSCMFKTTHNQKLFYIKNYLIINSM